jgi:preprotein translocase subunit SecD
MKMTWKIWLMFLFIFFALLSIFVNSNGITFLQSGLVVEGISKNSSIYDAGIRENHIITSINGQKINSFEEYSQVMSEYSTLERNKTKKIEIVIEDFGEIVTLTDNKIINDLSVSNIPKTRIKTGLDIQGGTRALVSSDHKLTEAELDDLIAVSQERLNVYGLTDLNIRKQSDSSGNLYMIIEIAGSSPKDLEELISKQGKFEARIGNETVFVGGNKDITYVGRTGQQDAMVTECFAIEGGEACNFQFVIYLSEEAAQRHADITDKLTINGSYLSKKLDFYIDDKLTSSLNIGASLKGSVATQISISGSGTGATREEAIKDAKLEMKKLQTILITGSLPFKLEIVKIDRISPFLGEKFIETIFIASFVAFASVCVIIFIRYRKIKLSLIMLGVAFSEIFMILGFSALIGANLDLASIAGIIAAIGTGINDQQVIVDETVRNKSESLKARIKNALFIVITSFATIVASLFPLFYAGAGLLRGFATTTIIGITIGVFITRPAFADIVKQLGD